MQKFCPTLCLFICTLLKPIGLGNNGGRKGVTVAEVVPVSPPDQVCECVIAPVVLEYCARYGA